MFKTQQVEPYRVTITKTILKKWNGEVRVWDTPQSVVEGATLLDKITTPIEAKVVEEQLDMYGSLPQRFKIKYSRNKEGWVIAEMVSKPKVKEAAKAKS